MDGEAAPADVLLEAIGYRFQDGDWLTRALTHPSLGGVAGAEGPGETRNYERLEFLGDRVLGLVIADMLFRRFPNEREGVLARRHVQLVRRETLTQVAIELDLGRHLRMSKGEQDAGGRKNPAILADACEAVIGAIYVDGGLVPATEFIERRWAPHMAGTDGPPKDPKTALQEWAQARGLPLPDYRIVRTQGPDHHPKFHVEVSVEGWPAESGDGKSKRAAEKAAALRLLAVVSADTDA